MANQKNRQWYRYTDNKARNWSMLVDKEWGDNAASGLSAFNANDPPFGPTTRLHRPRRVMYRDPETFRTVVNVVGTAAALASLPGTRNIAVPGSDAPVVYNLAGEIPEKLQVAQQSRNLTDNDSA